MISFPIKTHSRTELIDITPQVQEVVKKSGAESGICFIYVPHTTAGVTVNESYDPDVARDINTTLSRLVPVNLRYEHTEGNADAHIKSVLVNSFQIIPIEQGRLALGRWQGVFFCEFDGPRERRCLIKVISDKNKEE